MLAKAPFEQPYGRGINFQIQVENADAIHAAVIAAGLPIFLPMEERWYRRDDTEIATRQFIVEDPDGYLLRLHHDLGIRRITG